ncbi:MAG: CPBP family intramembrane glutamic endopeptidase [Candidatus Eisenbacteria bacterium]
MPGLWTWFTVISALGLVGILWGQAELALSVTLAGAFVAAHAADRDPGLTSLHKLLSGVLVAGGATVFALLAFWLATQSAAVPVRPFAVGIAGGGAVLCLLTALRPFSDGLAAALFRTAEPTHALRLGARLVMMVLLFALPGWAAFPGVLDSLAESGRPLLDTGQLLGSLVGLSVLALGAVGFLVRRGARATFDRLGLRTLRPAHYGVVALGMAALYVLNAGTEDLQHRWFPDLWDHDQRMSRLIAGGLGLGGSLLLGVSAGVGEELAMRGALQPRLGLVLTSLVFAVLHVHYSWFGMAIIFLLGMLLGVIRDRTSTTVAILVHSLYDIAAVFAAGGAAR